MSLLSTSEADITENPLLLDDLDWIASKVVNAFALWDRSQIFIQKAQKTKKFCTICNSKFYFLLEYFLVLWGFFLPLSENSILICGGRIKFFKFLGLSVLLVCISAATWKIESYCNFWECSSSLLNRLKGMVELVVLKMLNLPLSAHHFCFDKTLCMIWIRGTLSQQDTH